MDQITGAINKFAGGGSNQTQQQPIQGQQQQQSGGFLGGLGDKFNSAAGGGRESEKNEDALDKGTYDTLPCKSCNPLQSWTPGSHTDYTCWLEGAELKLGH